MYWWCRQKMKRYNLSISVILCLIYNSVCIGCVPLEYQSYGIMMCVKRINEWTNPMGHVQRTNPMGQEACYKKPDACIED